MKLYVYVEDKTHRDMSSFCLGHGERGARRNKIRRHLKSPLKNPDENLRVLIKKGPVSVETSLKELEEDYAGKPEWKVIEEGGVLSIPVEDDQPLKGSSTKKFSIA